MVNGRTKQNWCNERKEREREWKTTTMKTNGKNAGWTWNSTLSYSRENIDCRLCKRLEWMANVETSSYFIFFVTETELWHLWCFRKMLPMLVLLFVASILNLTFCRFFFLSSVSNSLHCCIRCIFRLQSQFTVAMKHKLSLFPQSLSFFPSFFLEFFFSLSFYVLFTEM